MLFRLAMAKRTILIFAQTQSSCRANGHGCLRCRNFHSWKDLLNESLACPIHFLDKYVSEFISSSHIHRIEHYITTFEDNFNQSKLSVIYSVNYMSHYAEDIPMSCMTLFVTFSHPMWLLSRHFSHFFTLNDVIWEKVISG